MRHASRIATAAVAAAIVAVAAPPASAQDFYRGKTVSIVQATRWERVRSAPRWLSCFQKTGSVPQNPKAIIFYNSMAAYLPSLLASSVLGYRNVLDLEDGQIPASGQKHAGFLARLVPRLFDRFCKGGALLACNALAEYTTSRPVLSYYGTAVAEQSSSKWQSEYVKVLMGGTLCLDTGAELLIDTIRQLRRDAPPWAAQLCFDVTGRGPSLEGLTALAAEPGTPKVIVYGRTTDMQYREVLRRCDVGLALKLNNGPLANTTFPSKVI